MNTNKIYNNDIEDRKLALLRILGAGYQYGLKDKILEFNNNVRISDVCYNDYKNSERLTQESKDHMLIELLQNAYNQGCITLTTTSHIYGYNVVVFASMLVVKRDLMLDDGCWGSLADSIFIVTESVVFSIEDCILQGEYAQGGDFKLVPAFLYRILGKLATRLVDDKLIAYKIQYNKGDGFGGGTTDVSASLLSIKPNNKIMSNWIERSVNL